MSIQKWLWKVVGASVEIENAYYRGHREGTVTVLEALRKEKIFLYGTGTIIGLNEFLAKEIPKDVSFIGCTFLG